MILREFDALVSRLFEQGVIIVRILSCCTIFLFKRVYHTFALVSGLLSSISKLLLTVVVSK